MHSLFQKGVFMLSKLSCSDSFVPTKMSDFQATIIFLILASTLNFSRNWMECLYWSLLFEGHWDSTHYVQDQAITCFQCCKNIYAL